MSPIVDPQANAQFFARTQVAAQTRRSLNPNLRIELDFARRSMQEITNLEDNWDGYGAPKIAPQVRINAWHALEHFTGGGAVPEITPRANGTIAFDWRANGLRAHFEVGRTRSSMYITFADGHTRYFDSTANELSDEARDALGSALAEASGNAGSSSLPMTFIRYTSAR